MRWRLAAPVVPLADRDQLHPHLLGEASQGGGDAAIARELNRLIQGG